MNHYEILGVERTASHDDIVGAYKKLAVKYHPDRAQGNEEKFKEIQAAYATLSDQAKRQEYDNHLDGRSTNNHAWGPGNIDEIFSQFFRQQGFQPQARRNRDIRVSVTLSLESTLEPQSLTISFQKSNGARVPVDITIPRGVQHNGVIKYNHLGDDMFQNLPRGDLYVQIQLLPHPQYTIHEQDVLQKINVTAWQAMLGGEVTVSGLDRKVFKVSVPASCQPGTKLKLPGQGLYYPNGQTRGDLYLQVDVTIPILTPDQQDTIRSWVNI